MMGFSAFFTASDLSPLPRPWPIMIFPSILNFKTIFLLKPLYKYHLVPLLADLFLSPPPLPPYYTLATLLWKASQVHSQILIKILLKILQKPLKNPQNTWTASTTLLHSIFFKSLPSNYKKTRSYQSPHHPENPYNFEKPLKNPSSSLGVGQNIVQSMKPTFIHPNAHHLVQNHSLIPLILKITSHKCLVQA